MRQITTHGRVPAPLLERISALQRRHELTPEHVNVDVWACGRPSCLHLTRAGALDHIDADRSTSHVNSK